MSKKYRVLHGVTFMTKAGKEVRIERGKTTDDLPKESIGWLLAQRHIEEVEDDPKEARERTKEVKAVADPDENKMEVLVADKSGGLVEPPVAEVEDQE
jgi:hypothetical protein